MGSYGMVLQLGDAAEFPHLVSKGNISTSIYVEFYEPAGDRKVIS
jgi:hypothetical protein